MVVGAIAAAALALNGVGRQLLNESSLLGGDRGGGGSGVATAFVQLDLAAFVRSAPSSTAEKVAILGEGVQVTIGCVVRGETVNYRGKTTSVWGYLWSPVEGYISDALLQTGRGGPGAARCSDPPQRPPSPPPSLGTLLEVNADGAAVRSQPSPASSLVVGLELGSSVMVACRTSGAEASRDGSTSTEWGRIVQPFEGYVSQVNLVSELSNLPRCA